MTDTTWHAPPGLIERFAADPASVDDARASSLEAHLIGCAACRAALDSMVDASLITDSWSSIVDVIDRPRTRSFERVLSLLGVPGGWARLLGATPGLSIACLVGVAAVTAFVVAASRADDATAAFLVVAPLLPLLAIAGVFAPVADPAGEVGIATPLHGFGLMARRAAVVLTAAFVLLGAADLALGDLGAPIAAWVLPSLALSVAALALATWISAEIAVAALFAGWLTGVSLVWWIQGRDTPLSDSATFGFAGQWVSIVVIVGALAVIALRHDRFTTMQVEVFR